jgi:hypothetical protein
MRKVKVGSLQIVCLFVAVAAALIVLVPAARSEEPELGGKTKIVGASISNTNPCDSATVSGNVNVTAAVSVFGQESLLPQLFVYVTFQSSSQTGTDGITYSVYGQSAATFNNLVAGETYYILPTNLYYYTGDTLRFVVPTNAQVEVNTNQVPTVVPVFPYSSSSTCIKK